MRVIIKQDKTGTPQWHGSFKKRDIEVDGKIVGQVRKSGSSVVSYQSQRKWALTLSDPDKQAAVLELQYRGKALGYNYFNTLADVKAAVVTVLSN